MSSSVTMALTSVGVACSMLARASTTALSAMGVNGASLAGWLVSGACGGSGAVVGGGGRVVVVVLVVEVVVVLELVEEVDDVSLDTGGRVLVGVGASVVVVVDGSSVVDGLKVVVVSTVVVVGSATVEVVVVVLGTVLVDVVTVGT